MHSNGLKAHAHTQGTKQWIIYWNKWNHFLMVANE